MRIAYLDCVGGISGDMTLGALLDLGLSPAVLIEGLRSLPLPPWELKVGRALRCGIDAARVEVVVEGKAAEDAPLLLVPPRDSPLQDAGATHGRTAPGHTHEHGGHTHGHGGHTHAHDAPTAPHREPQSGSLAEVLAIINDSALPERVREQSAAVFRALAEAEAAVHGVEPDAVRFHEVGRVDSIVDTVGTVLALHMLGVERVVCSPLPVGRGFVDCDHGRMPCPAPATARLLEGCPIEPTDVFGECVTPTGAAIARTLAAGFGAFPRMTVRGVGCGAGGRDRHIPNILRVFLGDAGDLAASGAEKAVVVLIEANLDDQNPQLFGPLIQTLMEAGALDAWVTPILMKKGRPAHQLSLLASPEHREALAAILFRESTTLGIRFREMQRECCHRSWREVETPYGRIRVKLGSYREQPCTAAPEFEDCLAAARRTGAPLKLVLAAAQAEAWRLLSGDEASG